MWTVQRALFLTLALAACGNPSAPRVDVAAPPDTGDAVGPYEIIAIITDDGSIASAAVEWSREGDATAPAPVNLVQDTVTSDRWRASLPGQPVGTVVKFTVRVTDDEGRTTIAQKDTKDGPVPFSFRVLGPGLP